MAEIHGYQGGIFYRNGYLAGTGIAFVDSDPDTLTDTGNGFVAAGFAAGDIINVTGSDSNDGNYTIDAGGVAAGTLTLVSGDSLTAEAAGDSIVLQTVPGTRIGGFFNWSISQVSDVHDTTDFADAGSGRTFTAGLTGWSGSAERWWLTGAGTANQGPAVGSEVLLRFFIRYTATPAVTTNYYYEGTAIITGHNPTTPVDEMVKGTISFQGTSTLTLVTRSTAWA